MPLIERRQIIQKCETQVLKDAIGFSFGIRKRNARSNTCDDLEIRTNTIFRRGAILGFYRLPDLGRWTGVGSITGKNEMWRQNADDTPGFSIERDRLSDGIRICSEFRVPEFVGHNHRPAFIGTES